MSMISGIKYIFQIPLEWFKQVDARVFGDHPGPGIQFNEAADGSRAIGIDTQVLDDRYSASASTSVSNETGTPTSIGSFPSEVSQTAGSLWTAGGSNGCVVLCVFMAEYSGGVHDLYAAKLTFSKDGLLVSVKKEANSGIEVMA